MLYHDPRIHVHRFLNVRKKMFKVILENLLVALVTSNQKECKVTENLFKNMRSLFLVSSGSISSLMFTHTLPMCPIQNRSMSVKVITGILLAR